MRITIEHVNDEWFVAQEDGANIWPTTIYESREKAAARVLQLLDLKTVNAQTYPESIILYSSGVEHDKQQKTP